MNKEHDAEYCTENDDAFFFGSIAGKLRKQFQNSPSDAPAKQTAQCIGDQVIYIRCPESKHLKNLDGKGHTESKHQIVPDEAELVPKNG